MVHHCLKCTGRVGQIKEHNEGFEQPVFCLEGSFFLITVLDSNVIVPPTDIKFCEDVGVLYLTNQVRYEG